MSHCLLVVPGAPLALRFADIATTPKQAGWSVQVVPTAAPAAWVDNATIANAAGRPAVSEHRDPSETRLLGLLVVAGITDILHIQFFDPGHPALIVAGILLAAVLADRFRGRDTFE